MNYIEIKICFENADQWKDIFVSFLADAGCDSFSDDETDNALLAYIPENLFDENTINELLTTRLPEAKLRFSVKKIISQDWNQIWESNYDPVCIANRCYIRAPFHEHLENIEYEIIIEPKMSFGTAHHETTSLMISYLLEENLKDKKVLDMGSGTGVLSILAHKKGAKPIVAIDNDEWAYKNNLENNERNHCEDISVIWGDAKDIGTNFDIIIANINRNILLNDMESYATALNKNGFIFFSGFYADDDLNIITQKANSLHLKYISHQEKNRWCAAKFQKIID